MEWSAVRDFDGVMLYLVSRLRPPTAVEARSAAQHSAGAVLCYEGSDKLHWISREGEGFRFYIGDRVYAEDLSVHGLLVQTARRYVLDFM